MHQLYLLNIFLLFQNMGCFINLFNYSKNNKLNLFNNDNYLFSKITNIHDDLINTLNLSEIIEESNTLKTIDNTGYFKNRFYNNTFFRKVRISEFNYKDKQMFNSVWYPQYTYDKPILSIDIMYLKENELLCFANIYELDKKYSGNFDLIKNTYPAFFNKRSFYLLPLKFILNDVLLFSDMKNFEKIDILNIIIENYINIYLDLDYNLINIEDCKEKHKNYNDIRIKLDKYLSSRDYFDKIKYDNMIDNFYVNK